MMNSAEFKKKCHDDGFAKIELDSIFRCIKHMRDAETFDDLKYFYDMSDYYRHGLWCYFCGMTDAEGMVYCSHLIGVLSKIYMRYVKRLNGKRW